MRKSDARNPLRECWPLARTPTPWESTVRDVVQAPAVQGAVSHAVSRDLSYYAFRILLLLQQCSTEQICSDFLHPVIVLSLQGQEQLSP